MFAFLPEDNIVLLKDEIMSEKIIPQSNIKVLVPGRIHLSVIDMNRFRLGEAGGGGVGIGLKLFTEVEITISKYKDNIKYERPAIISRILNIVRKVFSYQGYFNINIKQDYPKHIGLGSTSSAAVATFLALNNMFGNKLSNKQLVDIYVRNAVEECPTDTGKVVKCYETGTCPWVNILGGLVVVADQNLLLKQCKITNANNVLLIVPQDDGELTTSYVKESKLILDKGRIYDKLDSFEKAYLILMDLIPAMENNNIISINNVISNLNILGSKKSEIEYQNTLTNNAIHNLINEFCNERVLSGMSSVGPCVCFIGERSDIDNIEKNIYRFFQFKTYRTTVDNKGVIYYH